MRIRVRHETRYRYDTPPTGVIQTLRLTPRNYEGQFVVDWRIEVSADCRLDEQEDAFGNITHAFTADAPITELTVTADGVVDTQDTNGVVRDAIERFPPSLFLREAPLTHADAAMKAFTARMDQSNTLSLLHGLLDNLHEEIVFDTDPTHAATTAAEAFGLKRGVCQDMAHIFIGCARACGVPARYISGYLHRNDGVLDQRAGHAWAEAYVPDLGWVAFDPANGTCTTDAYVRVAVGLDYLGAAPVRGTRYGGGAEALSVQILVDQSLRQPQN
jgi:transglutaminase-like putative cysteine protease